MKRKVISTDEFKIELVPSDDGTFGYLRFENYRGEYLGSIDREERTKLRALYKSLGKALSLEASK